jgi:hypothetical protein
MNLQEIDNRHRFIVLIHSQKPRFMRLHILVLTSLSILLLNSCTQTKTTYVSVVFDVEDYISPVEEGVDDIPRWLAETMTDVGVTGTFFVIGEKARSLEERGRQDVIEAMASHDIGSHTNFGSIHPTVTELLEFSNWETGVQTMMKNESIGFEDLERIYKVPAKTLARHGGSYGPQLVYALGKMGKGYVYSPVHLPNHNAVWFCNTLNFHGDYAFFDDFYFKDELFNPAFDTLQKNFEKDMEGMDVVSFFGCHPTKVRGEQFWDFNFYEGANPDVSELLPPKLRPAESMETAKKNFKRLMEYLNNQDYIEITTYDDLMDRFSYQRDFITRKELQRIASEIVEQNKIIIDDYFSPAEVFAALAESLVSAKVGGKLPRKTERSSPIGPMIMPPGNPEISILTVDDMYELASQALSFVKEKSTLPSALEIEGKKIGLGSLLYLFGTAYVEIASGNHKENYVVHAFDPYPTENEEAIISEVEGYKNWIVHRPDLDMAHLAELTRLQLWTMKPAHER